jgi:hypothetical protein
MSPRAWNVLGDTALTNGKHFPGKQRSLKIAK